MRVLTFADGFISTIPPETSGIAQESYNILNDQTDTNLFTIDSTQYKSAFIDFELTRSTSSESYIQTGSIVFYFDGTDWQLITGLTQNDDIISSSLDEAYNVSFSFTNDAGIGTLKYSSGNMVGTYQGKLKLLITRVKVV